VRDGNGRRTYGQQPLMTMVTVVVSARRLKVGELIAAIYCRLVLQRGEVKQCRRPGDTGAGRAP
jgi:hypothetical protein